MECISWAIFTLGYTWVFLDCLHEYQLKRKFICAILEGVANENGKKCEYFPVEIFPTHRGQYLFECWPNAEPDISTCSSLQSHGRAQERSHQPCPLLGFQLSSTRATGQEGRWGLRCGPSCVRRALCPGVGQPLLQVTDARDRKVCWGPARSYHLLARLLPNPSSSISVSRSEPVILRLQNNVNPSILNVSRIKWSCTE